MNKHKKFAEMTVDFDIPHSRRDTTQLENVRWLLHNIRVENKDAPRVDEVLGLLLMISRYLKKAIN